MYPCWALCLAVCMLYCCVPALSQPFIPSVDSETLKKHIEYEGYDGWYNNPAHPEWGGVDSPLLRILPSAYEDGVYEPSGGDRPNPIEISDSVMSGETGKPSYKSRTALMVFFGQQVVEEILDAQRPGCPPEYFNIEIPKNHSQYDPHNVGDRVMPFLRSRYDFRTGYSPNNPRQQLNEITPFLDGGLTYGIGKTWADALRLFKGGRLEALNDTDENAANHPALNDIRLPMANPPPPRNHYLKNVKRFYKLGNPRGNENPMLLTFGILWFRWHNVLARRFEAQSLAGNWNWTDEKIFNEARKWTIATHQKIVMYDWLPSWLGEGEDGSLPPYKGYDKTVHAGISHVFQSAAMRFGHTLVPPGIWRRGRVKKDGTCDFRMSSLKTGAKGRHGLRTCNTYWNPQEAIEENDIDEMLMGMASQITEREDNIITPDLRGNVFGPLEFSRRDLMAINIQRGRDHGLPDYNTAREQFRLKRITKWEEINPQICANLSLDSCEPVRNLRDIYTEHAKKKYNGKVDPLNILDIWAAGIVETRSTGPGPLFQRIIRDQFQRIRDGDRFWFENNLNGLFTTNEVNQIKKVTLYDIILATTDITKDDIQKNPFFFATAEQNKNNCMATCNDTVRDCSLECPRETADPCPQPFQLKHGNDSHLEECTPVQYYDYFTGSDVPYILTFSACVLFFLLCVVLLVALAKWKQRKMDQQKANSRAKERRKSDRSDLTTAIEYVGPKEGSRTVQVKFDDTKKSIQVLDERGRSLRVIDLSMVTKLVIFESADKQMKKLLVRMPKEYDLILSFDQMSFRQEFIEKLKTFLHDLGIGCEERVQKEKEMLSQAITKGVRQKLLEQFFKKIYSHAFVIEDLGESQSLRESALSAREIFDCELTRVEFADALGAKPNSLFIENMFQLVDKDNNGYISFREFLDMTVIFSKGTAEDKAKLMFDMYDVENVGSLTRKDFETMLRSFMELSSTSVEQDQIEKLIDTMFQEAGITSKESVSLEDFKRMLSNYSDALGSAQINWNAAGVKNLPGPGIDKNRAAGTMIKREATLTRARNIVYKSMRSETDERIAKRARAQSVALQEVQTIKKQFPRTPLAQKLYELTRYIENYRLHIFWLTLYTLVVIGVFAERAYYFSVEREHAGLRRIAGYGVTVTRGAASSMMFTYASLLVTMCRNTITYLRETFLHQYIPFDSAIAFHKYIAGWALFFTVMHVIGHAINFYHISTQTPGDLTCIFRDFFRPTHVLPTFSYWCWNTITGVTGVLCTLIVIIMYTFAVQYARRHVFKAFWLTHNMFYLLFVLMFLHGSGNLVQPPFMHFFSLGPIILFTLDKLYSSSRNKVEISIIKAELLPSDVTMVEFKRPLNFEYMSGQWVRIACKSQGEGEYHPFTLSSAPHEDTLSLHIRAVGPWTTNFRRTLDPINLKDKPYPKLYLDGPFGEGHQDWYKYDVSVLVGGGIGVTPFASILKDLVARSAMGAKFVCKKVYFIWVTRTQKHYEWLTDIIREVEEKDVHDLVSVHIFITQFQQKFDMRTTMLYICERHFQKISHRSLFTGLRSITHFGRPDFESFLNALQDEHSQVSKIGVFSCGPPPMTNSVDKACTNLNKFDGASFIHHFENF